VKVGQKDIPFGPLIEQTVKPGPGGPTNIYDLSKTLTMYEVQKKLTELYRVKIFNNSLVKNTVSRSHAIYVHS
jgi:hypothetical protein